jgi:hypothetical protein
MTSRTDPAESAAVRAPGTRWDLVTTGWRASLCGFARLDRLRGTHRAHPSADEAERAQDWKGAAPTAALVGASAAYRRHCRDQSSARSCSSGACRNCSPFFQPAQVVGPAFRHIQERAGGGSRGHDHRSRCLSQFRGTPPLPVAPSAIPVHSWSLSNHRRQEVI